MKKNILIIIPILLIIIGGLFFLYRMQKTNNALNLGMGNSGTEPQQQATTPTDISTNTKSQITPSPLNTIQPTPDVSKNNQFKLTVTSPINNALVTTTSINVIGTTIPKAEVSVNEADTIADAKGNFSAKITIDEGDNFIAVVATDENGNIAEQDLSVTYQAAN
jgi:hypothetical protein